MTDAPERIWAWIHKDAPDALHKLEGCPFWAEEPCKNDQHSGMAEYIRADSLEKSVVKEKKDYEED